MKAQEKRAIDLAEQLLEKMRTEIAELKENEAELNKLTTMEDNIQFLQVSASVLRLFPGQFETQHISGPSPGLPDSPSSARALSSACGCRRASPDI